MSDDAVRVEVKIGSVPLDPDTAEPRLLQTKYADPFKHVGWRVCCVSIMLAASNRVQVEPAVDLLYSRGILQTPGALVAVSRSTIARILDEAGTGLQVQKARALQLFTSDYRAELPVDECWGAGAYVAESYDLLVAGDMFKPTDYALLAWSAWKRVNKDLAPDWGWGE